MKTVDLIPLLKLSSYRFHCDSLSCHFTHVNDQLAVLLSLLLKKFMWKDPMILRKYRNKIHALFYAQISICALRQCDNAVFSSALSGRIPICPT